MNSLIIVHTRLKRIDIHREEQMKREREEEEEKGRETEREKKEKEKKKGSPMKCERDRRDVDPTHGKKMTESVVHIYFRIF